MNIFRKVLSIPLILFAVLCFIIFIIAPFKGESFNFILGMFITTVIFSMFGFIIWPKNGNKNQLNTNLKTINSEDITVEDEIYSQDRPLPDFSIDNKQDILLPESDNYNETGWLDVSDQTIPINLLCYLHYKDAKGQESKRRVTIKKMEPWNDEYALLAYCHERQAHRTFKLSGILSLCDLETGELINNPYQYFLDRYNDSPLGRFTKLMKLIEDQILVLVFIARADGRLTVKERKVIADFINKKSDSEIDFLVLDHEVKMLYCELPYFNKSIKKLKNLNQNEKELFIQTINLIIECDKNVDPMEIAARDKIEKILLS